jgi:hypothetical protein
MKIFSKLAQRLVPASGLDERLQAIEQGIANQTIAFDQRLGAIVASQDAYLKMQQVEVELLQELIIRTSGNVASSQSRTGEND